jgi:hypothetical protein
MMEFVVGFIYRPKFTEISVLSIRSDKIGYPRGWNEPLIRKMFLFHEVEEILNLRIPVSEGDDILSWWYENNGLFSVRSAYKLAMEGGSKNNCGTSMSADKKNL